jgi:hypothetical protein
MRDGTRLAFNGSGSVSSSASVTGHSQAPAAATSHPGLVDQEGDRPFGMLPREARRRIKAAAIGSNDFGMPLDRKPCLYVAGDRST